nr:hypothetical protein [Tanacetum cinerariifolium]
VLLLAWDIVSKIKVALGNKQYKPKDIHDLFRKVFNDVQNIHEELAEYINTPSWNRPIVYYDDDDDEDYTIAITPNFFLSPIESENISNGECDLPLCDDFPKSHLVTFSNPLFDIDNEFTSSDDELFSEKDVPMENFKILSNPLFDLDEEIISTEVNPIQNEVLESITSIPPGIDYFDEESNLIQSLLNRTTSIDSTSKIDSLLDEFAGELIFLKSMPPGIDEADFDLEVDISLIKRLLYVENSIESFLPSHILVEDSDPFMEEIDLFLASNGSIPPGIDSDYSDS